LENFHSPSGPKGRFDPCNFGFWGIWNFSTNKFAQRAFSPGCRPAPRSKGSSRGATASTFAPYKKLLDFKIWAEENRRWAPSTYPPRDDVTALLAGYPALAGVGTQMTTQNARRMHTQQGKWIEQPVDFAQSELEGYKRN
jgi:hypothetical protein